MAAAVLGVDPGPLLDQESLDGLRVADELPPESEPAGATYEPGSGGRAAVLTSTGVQRFGTFDDGSDPYRIVSPGSNVVRQRAVTVAARG